MTSTRAQIEVEISYSETLQAEDDEVPEPTLIERWVDAAVLTDAASPPTATSVSLLITDAGSMCELNEQFRDRAQPTNVLSFPCDGTSVDLPPGLSVDDSASSVVNLLGDIALCASVIKDEAVAQGKSNDAHWAHMIVHGMLHLQGYDHIVDEDAAEMETLEKAILQGLGYPDPYDA